MATFSAVLARIFSSSAPAMSVNIRDCDPGTASSQAVPSRTIKSQYASAGPMRAAPPSKVEPKAVLATTQPATQDATMQIPSEDLVGKTEILTMRGGIDHDHHGTRMSHDICCCLICCDCMDDCCTAIDDVICCE
ncbi:uncharacterized protein RCC_06832 [Ramularia collo-cygni]|uniref:Cysteine-rich transmembrane CYSTM domain-containing protein n=1 Tax=Ramularia collo-cygni TaxID=112498 RepID=A0A2D3UW45_9PEZI|nr:uncharacterized protein RCC_06832 [Ramularia collo-cygni]CZT20971.1 uncharacterized protein RCC_06832 [Ramularia collo-cygni]